MTKTRNNHFVSEGYQKGFLLDGRNELYYLDLTPDTISLPDGRQITKKPRMKPMATSQCFYQTDLYTTFFGNYINDEIERLLFGPVDNDGPKAVKAFIRNDPAECHRYFRDFFSYLDSQKIRTPKGLDWIRKHYQHLNQPELMKEMQIIREMHCALWMEGVREIVSAEASPTKFILTDHPVTIYNHACPPEHKYCAYPDDPSIALKGTQTLFPMDKDHCLILTNYEYAKNPLNENPLEKRTNAHFMRNTIVRTLTRMRKRSLSEEDVVKINYILKRRARRYIASPDKAWLFPEKEIAPNWFELHQVLLPPAAELYHYGGELFVGYKDGSVHYQDPFGRTTPENEYLKKPNRNTQPGRNDLCGCGSGKKYKKCCLNKDEDNRSSWNTLSIRERNLSFCRGVENILGLSKGKTWDDVRRELSNDQVKEIHQFYESLWPVDTDIFGLLPKPDNALRALYTGIIDARVISRFALGLTPFFDEILIQHPFIHPASVRPEFSPVHSPREYKEQTLKNVLLLFILIPFVKAGFVNFIPDPCALNRYLHRQILNMATQRSENYEIGKEERRLLNKLYINEKNVNDPFTLLQDDVLSEHGGQFHVINMAPNLEMSLFIAQATGSVLVTDSPFRWQEIMAAQHKAAGGGSSPWNDVGALISNLRYVLRADPKESFHERAEGSFTEIRRAFREIFVMTKSRDDAVDTIMVDKLKSGFLAGHEIMMKKANIRGRYGFEARWSCLIPKGGFCLNDVQRLLLTSGGVKHLNNVPMAMFVVKAS